MTLNHNCGCFSGVGGIAGNGSWLDAGGDFGERNFNLPLKPNRRTELD